MEFTEQEPDLTRVQKPIDSMVATTKLLEEPRKAEIWYTIHNEGMLIPKDGADTAQEIAELTGIPQATVYEDLRDMEKSGSIRIKEESRPKKYMTAVHSLLVTEEPLLPEEGESINPVFIGVIAKDREDGQVSRFVDRNNYTRLALCVNKVFSLLADNEYNENNRRLKNTYEWLSSTDASMIEDKILRTYKELETTLDIEFCFPEEFEHEELE